MGQPDEVDAFGGRVQGIHTGAGQVLQGRRPVSEEETEVRQLVHGAKAAKDQMISWAGG